SSLELGRGENHGPGDDHAVEMRSATARLQKIEVAAHERVAGSPATGRDQHQRGAWLLRNLAPDAFRVDLRRAKISGVEHLGGNPGREVVLAGLVEQRPISVHPYFVAK